MLKRLSAREILINMASEWETTIAMAWLDAVREITSAVILKNLVAELERGNLDGAMRLLNIDADRFARFEGSILQAYNAGGQAVVGSMPKLIDPEGNRVHFSWGVRNTPAEQALRQHAATLVDDLVGEQLTVARSILVDGLARGQNPRQTALKLVGPINRRTGFREGGVLGLTPSSTQTLDKMYLGLRSGDTQAMRDYLTYANRNKLFDGHVRRALEGGGSVPADAVDRIVTAYSNISLRKRGERLALHETGVALEKAKRDAFQQQIDAGKLEADDLTKTWGRSISKNKRADHLAMVGQTIPFAEKFTLPSGVQCDGPRDPSLPASESIGCTCALDVTISFTDQALRRYRQRTGLE